jgi:cyclic pyranopterin phosphate synthase
MDTFAAVQVGHCRLRQVQGGRPGMVMTNIRVLEKHGGKSGDWTAQLQD